MFSTTKDRARGAYLLPSGKMLDLGGPYIAHQVIRKCVNPKGERLSSINKFMDETGAMRLYRGGFGRDNSFNFGASPVNLPTPAQLRFLSREARKAGSVWYDIHYPRSHPKYNKEWCALRANEKMPRALTQFREDIERCHLQTQD